MEHYVCTGGCQGVSDVAGVCQAQSCAHVNQPLQACDCTDGAHAGVMQSDAVAEEATDNA